MSLIRFAATVFVGLAIATASWADKAAETTKTLIKFQLDWAGAVERNDVEAIGRFLHQDFTFASPTGAMANRKDHLEDFRNGNARFPLVALSEVEVRVYGETAVLASRPTINGSVKVDGKLITLRCQTARWTDTLIRRDGSWTCVARQQSNIPLPATRAAVFLEHGSKRSSAGRKPSSRSSKWKTRRARVRRRTATPAWSSSASWKARSNRRSRGASVGAPAGRIPLRTGTR
jgi:ketosteroid isomerase-like protein